MPTPATQAKKDADPDHAGQPARPHGELGSADGGGHAGLGVAQARSTGHHGEEGARQATLEVVGYGPLLHVLAEHGRDHVGRSGHGQQGQPDPQHGDDAERRRWSRPRSTTQAAMARPWWRTRPHHPVNSEPTRAPAPGAA